MIREHVELWQVIISSLLRYSLFAGSAYFLFYVWKRNIWQRFKIQPSYPDKRKIQFEVNYSLSTAVIFAFVIYTVLFSPLREYSRLYRNINDHSLLYLIISPLLLILLHDTYFYWMHRFMHWKVIFPYIHHIHHHSHNPTPLAAFSFHPLEALLEIAILPLAVFAIPFHPLAVGLFSLYMIVMNVMGHLGHELYPERFIHSRVFRFFNTSTHHNMHHHYGKYNYGLYFNIWDKLMNTNHARYEQEFTSVTRNAAKELSQNTFADKKEALAE